MRDKNLELLQQRPFRPFRIQLSNGTVQVVRHPDQAMLAPGYIFIGIPASDAPGPDVSDVAFISLLHVVEVDPLISAGASSN